MSSETVSTRWDPHARLLTVQEAAASAGRPESTVRRWLAAGTLPVRARRGTEPLLLEVEVLQVEARARARDRTWAAARTAALRAYPPDTPPRPRGA